MARELSTGPFKWLQEEGRPFALGDRRSRKLLSQVEHRHPHIKDRLFNTYLRIADNSNYHKADLWLENVVARLKISDEYRGIYADSPFEAFKSFADQISKRLEQDFSDFARRTSGRIALDQLIDAVEACGIDFPVRPEHRTDKDKVIPALARVFDSVWWRRQLRQKAFRASESVYRELGIVSSKSNIYVSEHNFRRYLSTQADTEALLATLEAENQFGYTATLQALKESSISNPKNRRNELMTRIGGFEDYATELGHAAVFYTLTCPSKYHATHSNGRRNTNYRGTSPRDANDYLNATWQRLRAAWYRAGIQCYGIRTVEPHHDGTPHWHLLLFMPVENLPKANRLFAEYALHEDGDEPGALESRFRIEEIDPEKGRATGYVAKYVSKCIDGYEVGQDSYGRDAVESAARIRAWSSIWGIRQFQFIGSPSVTVYRELRRLRSVPGVRTGLIEQLEKASDNGNWKLFVELMGGTRTKLTDQPLRAMMVLQPSENKYFEQTKKLLGLFGVAGEVVTRLYEWTIRRVRSQEDNDVSDLECGVFTRGANAPPWSSVNNCTDGQSPYQTD